MVPPRRFHGASLAVDHRGSIRGCDRAPPAAFSRDARTGPDRQAPLRPETSVPDRRRDRVASGSTAPFPGGGRRSDRPHRATFEGSGESEDTLAVFISDNGLQWGEHALFGKSTPYLPSVRVPLHLRWPGHVAPGAEDNRLVAGIDLAPTLLSAVGLAPGATPDGLDLLDPEANRPHLLLEFRGFPAYPVPTWSALITTRDRVRGVRERPRTSRLP